MKITRVVPLEDLHLLIESADGQVGLFDVTPYIASEAFAPLRDAVEFQQVANGGYFIEWPCGADLSADTIEAHWVAVDRSPAEPRHVGTCTPRAGSC
jgi:Protein of unknown function (DUF2442)